MSEDLNTSVTYLAEHAKVLRDGAAPHQQPLANHIQALVDHARSGPALEQNLQLDQLRRNVAVLIDERDNARMERDTAVSEHQAALRQITELESDLADASRVRQELDAKLAELEKAAEGKTGTGIASTAGDTHADLKEKAKASTAKKTGGKPD